MKNTLLPLAAALALVAMPAVSQAQASDPLSFNVSLTSDYRYRGISQSRLRPALQGGADYALPGGFYVGTWASTIRWIEDAGRLAGVDTGDAPVEIDFYGGYKAELAKGFGFDVGLLQYWYPGSKLDRIADDAETTEAYAALLYGPATLKYSHSLTTLFGFPDSKNSQYLDLSATLDAGNGISVIPHVGRQRVRRNSDFSYTDYSVTVAKDFSGFTFSAAFVGTNAKDNDDDVFAYPSPSFKNLGRRGLVVAVKKVF